MGISVKSTDSVIVNGNICTVFLHQTGTYQWKISGEYQGEVHQASGKSKAGVMDAWKNWAKMQPRKE